MPVIKGEKTESERFPGAVSTYCIEAMMQDRKALQAGTSHFLGQNFSRACEIKFLDAAGKEEFAWTTSWGVSTRLVGGLIMTHGDDDGLIVPPRLAPSHIVILPVMHDDSAAQVLDFCDKLAVELRGVRYDDRPLEVEVDKREGRGGDKVWSWIKKGVPIYLEIGPRDIASDSVFVGRRDKSRKERFGMQRAEFVGKVSEILADIQNNLFERAKAFRDGNIKVIDNKDDFYKFFTPENKEKPEIHGGFALCHWNGSAQVEEQVKNDLNVTIRCIPLDGKPEGGKCVISGEKSERRVIFAKSY